jgi:hypothetical protein
METKLFGSGHAVILCDKGGVAKQSRLASRKKFLSIATTTNSPTFSS